MTKLQELSNGVMRAQFNVFPTKALNILQLPHECNS